MDGVDTEPPPQLLRAMLNNNHINTQPIFTKYIVKTNIFHSLVDDHCKTVSRCRNNLPLTVINRNGLFTKIRLAVFWYRRNGGDGSNYTIAVSSTASGSINHGVTSPSSLTTTPVIITVTASSTMSVALTPALTYSAPCSILICVATLMVIVGANVSVTITALVTVDKLPAASIDY